MTMSKENSNTKLISLLSDSPSKLDLLDYRAYQDALVDIVKGLESNTSLSIGIFGEWGSGKTTLLRMIRDRLKTEKIKTIWVNVWQFGNEEDVWNAFLQALLLNIKNEMSLFKKILFNLGLLRRRVDWDKLRKQIPELLAKIIFVCISVYLSVSNIIPSEKLSTSNALAGAGTVLSSILAWYLLIRPYINAIRDRVNIDLKSLVKDSPLKRRVSVLEQFKTYFEDMVVNLVGKKDQLVVFIDDLDRCPPDRIVQVLDAIKLFVDVPNCIYIMGLDRDIIEQAIRQKYEAYENTEEEAREYLQKIIGLPFDLPPLSDREMESLVSELGKDLPEPERSSQIFALGQEPNPRKVKRTINMFLLLWTLSQQRKELLGVIKPIRLAKIVVIQHSYRIFYKLLLSFPSYLGLLEAFFRNVKEEPASQDQLDSSETGDSNQEESKNQNLPEDLIKLSENENLKRLLTLFSDQDPSESETSFTIFDGQLFQPISEDEIRAYLQLTYSIAAEQLYEDTAEIREKRRRSPIYISYRREDSSGYAGRVHDRLRSHFGDENIITDIYDITPGADFSEAIHKMIGNCDVLIAIIGKKWLTEIDSSGSRRIDSPNDIVRMEIETALNFGITIIPLLVGQAEMPSTADLPESIVELTYRQALEITDQRFDDDIKRLIMALEQIVEKSKIE